MNTKIPSRYKDIVSRSVLIHPGPPAVYQLRPKKEEIENLTKMTVGERNVIKTNRTILLVGETGRGKSTLINTLVNYTMGVKWEDEVWFHIVEEKDKKFQLESKTTDVIVYEIFGFEDETLPYSLTIIDTPGYGDTRGVKQDDIICQRLLTLFQSDDGVYEVHAVGLVIKASDNQLSDRLLYIFSSLMSLFGKNLEKNIIALITYSNGVKPTNAFKALTDANIKSAKNEKNEPVHFLFDNCQHEGRTEESQFGLENAWKISQKGMREVTAFLEKSKPRNLMKTATVLNDRSKLTDSIQKLKEKFNLIELKQTEIRTTQEAWKKHEEEMMKNEKFTVEVDEVYKDKQDIDGGRWGFGFFFQGAVCCTVCEENCHYPGCTRIRKPEDCKIMKDGHCSVCTNKCPPSNHVKETWIYVNKTKKVEKTDEKMKEKYEENKSEYNEKLSLMENLKEEMKQLTAEKSRLLNESYQLVVGLEQIALKADSASTIVHLDFLIEKVNEEGDTEKVEKLEEIRSKEEDGTRAALENMFGKLFKK